jgi:V/A-type H+-transporting ATPase subunit K
MVKKFAILNVLLLLGMAVMLGTAIAPHVFAAEEAESQAVGAEDRKDTSMGEAARVAGIALAAALAMAAGAFGTAKVQAAIGSGGTGALAEKPELFTSILILVALPETIVVLAFVISFLIIQTI